MKFCNRCEKDKPLSDFSKGARWCKPCRNEYSRNHYAQNKDSVRSALNKWRSENREKHRAYNAAYRQANPAKVRAAIKRWTDENPLRRFAAQSLGLKKRAGKVVTITIDEVVALWVAQDGLCALSGLPMRSNFGRKGGSSDSPTLDRIKPELGYVPGNVRFLRYCVNAGRGTLTDDEYIEMCRAVVTLADSKG